MTNKKAKADVTPVRQRTQYTCMSTSLMMCLQALGHKVTEDEVNDVMGARPKKGAAWENALAAAQHYGCRATLVTPSTVQQLKQWTDRGIPVMIAWNPEGRPWSHASVVFDVDDDLNVYVADPNIPDPDETVRIVPKGDFYSKWSEKWPDYIVRRPAMAVEREITPEGRQVMASTNKTRIQQQPLMTMPDYGVAEEAEMQDTLQERWERGFQEPKTASRDLGVRSLEHSLGRDVSALWKVLSKQYGRVSVRVDDHKFIAFYYKGRNDDPTFVDEVIDQWGPIARKHKLRTKPQHKGNDFVSFALPRRAFDEGVRIVANDTDSGAGSDEDMFYKDPEKREVLEFAQSGAISNSVEVAVEHAGELDIPLKQELKEVAEAPPLPTEIVEEPGGAAVSTLNRYVIKTDDPAVAPAVKMNKDRMAFWKAELESK